MEHIINKPNFLNVESDLYRDIVKYLNEETFKTHQIRIYDKYINIPRLQLFLGDGDDNTIAYSYSNSRIYNRRWPQCVKTLASLVSIITKERKDYNCVLINKYRDGNDYIGPHSDDERELENKYIASYSIGDTRTFLLEHRHDPDKRMSIELKNNHLFAFSRDVNRLFKHSIPKKKDGSIRYNLTFRYIDPIVTSF